MKIVNGIEDEGNYLGSCCARSLFFIFYGQPASCFQSIEFMCASCRRTYDVFNLSLEINSTELTVKAVEKTGASLCQDHSLRIS